MSSSHPFPAALGALAVAVAALAAPAAHADVISFDDLVGTGEFASHVEDGYTVSKTPGSSGCKAPVFGNAVPSVFGGRVCDGKQNGHYAVTGLLPFVFESIDLAANNGDLTYFFTGLMGGVELWSVHAELASDTGVFHTIWSGQSAPIDTLQLQLHTRQGSSFNFDNIVLTAVDQSAVPEPTTAALVLLALAGAGLLRRRRVEGAALQPIA
jgi:hypothetical protein